MRSRCAAATWWYRGTRRRRGPSLRIRPRFALFPLDPFELRAVDIAISDDMLRCLDALPWGRADLHTLVPDGDRRMQAVIARWGLRWPDGP